MGLSRAASIRTRRDRAVLRSERHWQDDGGAGDRLRAWHARLPGRLSRVVSKYIGETEKQLDAVFNDAERAGAVLLFDEADALFGKRSEIKDSHDRYANIEVAYLLQRMEAFSGLAILTTNLRRNLDDAFLRRLRFVVEFPKPDAPAREAIWRLCLPQAAPLAADVNLRLLARRLELTGGSIRQITIRAAFAAAADGAGAIAMRHVIAAARAELSETRHDRRRTRSRRSRNRNAAACFGAGRMRLR